MEDGRVEFIFWWTLFVLTMIGIIVGWILTGYQIDKLKATIKKGKFVYTDKQYGFMIGLPGSLMGLIVFLCYKTYHLKRIRALFAAEKYKKKEYENFIYKMNWSANMTFFFSWIIYSIIARIVFVAIASGIAEILAK